MRSLNRFVSFCIAREVIRHGPGLSQRSGGRPKVSRAPQDDGGHDEVEARGAVMLVFVNAVACVGKLLDEDSAFKAVAGLALVQFPRGRAVQPRLFDPIGRELGALQSAQIAQYGGDAVLAWTGGQLAHEDRSGQGGRILTQTSRQFRRKPRRSGASWPSCRQSSASRRQRISFRSRTPPYSAAPGWISSGCIPSR